MLIDRERQEAIDAGERALDSLYGVRKELESAGNWGLLDMFGGGMFTTFVKHSKMNDAQRYMERAKRDLAAFSRELADMMVQSRIRDAQSQVDDAIYRVESILSRLRNQG